MAKCQRGGGRPKDVADVPWITAQGTLDLTKFPIEPLLRQSLDQDDESYRSACTLLGSMCAAGRREAGICLLGLAQFYQNNLERLTVVVQNLSHLRTPESVRVLVSELRRVSSNNSTRRYLASVLRALSRFPPHLVRQPLLGLSQDSSFSVKMRQKFEAMLEGCSGNVAGGR